MYFVSLSVREAFMSPDNADAAAITLKRLVFFFFYFYHWYGYNINTATTMTILHLVHGDLKCVYL